MAVRWDETTDRVSPDLALAALHPRRVRVLVFFNDILSRVAYENKGNGTPHLVRYQVLTDQQGKDKTIKSVVRLHLHPHQSTNDTPFWLALPTPQAHASIDVSALRT